MAKVRESKVQATKVQEEIVPETKVQNTTVQVANGQDVKFLRGTAANYAALTSKDSKTFYYTTDDNQLYIGAVKLSNLNDISALETAVKGATGWTSDMTLVALNSAINDVVKSGGTIDTKISTALGDYYTKSQTEALLGKFFDLDEKPTEPLDADTYKVGDIVIVKTVPYEGASIKYMTAYHVIDVEGDLMLSAMDGNYSAENVYFNADLTYTKAIGELPAVPSSGSATLSAKGKTVKSVFDTILAKRQQPSVTDPATTIGGTQSNQDVEIGTSISKSGTLTSSLSAGSYTYGPATGVSATAWETEVKYTQGKSGSIATGTTTSTPYSYSFQMGTDGETIKVYYKATATHGEGAVAKDNLGDPSNPVKKVAAGTKSKDATTTYTCYRNMFYGTRTDKTALDSGKIRGLSKLKQQAKSSNSLDVSVPVGAMRVIIAVPAGRSVTSVHDRNGLGAEIFSSFSTETVSVEGAEGYTAVNYTVYYLDYANANDKANHYDVTIA